jgi:hypothetical protein
MGSGERWRQGTNETPDTQLSTTFAPTLVRQGMNSLGQVLPIQFKTQAIMGYVRNFGHPLSHSKNK